MARYMRFPMNSSESGPKTVLIIAGLDPSGGAGILADAAVVGEHGLHAAGVVTALTEQDSTQCYRVTPVDPAVLAAQLDRVLDDLEIGGVKIGMLAGTGTLKVVAAALERLRGTPVVLDPVLRASSGAQLFDGDPERDFDALLGRATVVTPNLEELAALTGCRVSSRKEMTEAARRLRERRGAAVLAKGGHLEGEAVDLLIDESGELSFAAQRIAGPAPHGTGCALSTELACLMALGVPLRDAARQAVDRVRIRIAQARRLGHGRPFLG